MTTFILSREYSYFLITNDNPSDLQQMPPGRPNVPIRFWFRPECPVQSVSLRWSYDDWTKGRSSVFKTRPGILRRAHVSSPIIDYPLTRNAQGEWEITLYPLMDGRRIEFKFILDQVNWVCNEQQPTQVCRGGFRNNVMYVPDD